MSFWWLENLIDESTLVPPCKHVLKTLCRQINPPDAWDKHDPDAWDPASDPEALLVWYDRVKLSLLTSYSEDSLSRIVGQLGPPPKQPRKRAPTTYYAVLHVETPAAQHYTARLRIDLAALRALHDPRLDALEAERHKTREAEPWQQFAGNWPKPNTDTGGEFLRCLQCGKGGATCLRPWRPRQPLPQSHKVQGRGRR